MIERSITIIDSENDRRDATARTLGTLFDGVPIEADNWRNKTVRTFAAQKAAEIWRWTMEGRASLVVTNIDGVEEGLFSALQSYADATRFHCLITTCYGRADAEKVLHEYKLKLSPSIGHIECPSCGLGVLDERRMSHRDRLRNYFEGLPGDHPFSIGSTLRQAQGDNVSRSTTYSTELPETYAASNR